MRQCRPGDPEAKGLVERGNGYLETSFLPGRTFTSPADFNAQLGAWLPIANTRTRAPDRVRARPTRWEADRAAMLALPPVAPVTGWRIRVRLPRDHYVRVDSNDYSVAPGAWSAARSRSCADLATVTVTCDGTVVAAHDRCWARHQTITDPAHRQAPLELAATPRPQRPAAAPGGAARSSSATWPTTTPRSGVDDEEVA